MAAIGFDNELYLTTQSELEVLAVSLSNALSDELRYAKGPISTPTDGVLV